MFDKTGTLTYGNLKVSKIYNYSDYDEEELLKIVTSLEDKSAHPIASAFKNDSKKLELEEIENFKNIPGLGLFGIVNQNEYYVGNSKILTKEKIKNPYSKEEKELSKAGNSIVYVVENKKIIALIGVKDIVRNNAKLIIKELKSLNKTVIMLTGDNALTANEVASSLGINKVISNVMPADKTKEIRKLMEQGKKVMMIGDGINDAPSLATATIGVSLGSGTDIASNSADVILMNNNLMSIVNLIKISKKTIRNIKQNLFWAFFYNVVMIPIAMGIFSKWNLNMNPMFAGFAMIMSSFTVILNALRLKKIKLEKI